MLTNRGFRDNMMWYHSLQGKDSRLSLVIFCGKEKPQMSRVCRTAKEFAEAVKNNEEYITIEGDLKNGVLRIKATGKVAWGVCVASLAVAIAAVAVAPVGGGAPAGATSGSYVRSRSCTSRCDRRLRRGCWCAEYAEG